MVTTLAGILINVLLLLGVKQKKPLFVLIWLICTIIFVSLMVITLVLAIWGFVFEHQQTEALAPIIVYALTCGKALHN